MKRVLVTRQQNQSEEFISLLKDAGFAAFSLPLIKTIPTNEKIPNNEYDIVVLTSPIAVSVFAPNFGRVKIHRLVAVGAKTAKKIEECGIKADDIPDEFSAEGLQRLFDKGDVLPGAEKRAGDLEGYFNSRGAKTDKISTYETVPLIYEKGFVDKFLAENSIDIVTLTSPSTAESFLMQSANHGNVKLVSIGRTTWKYLKERQHESVYPEVMTIEGMTELISNLYKGV